MDFLGAIGDYGAGGARTRAPLIIFICANCARPAQAPASTGRPRPVVPNFGWPMPAREVHVPCTGRLQPEHILKAFESGASVVGVVACQEGNCHHIEGSRRCALRMDYIRSILEEIGLGHDRLLIFHLPGSADEDMAAAEGRSIPQPDRDGMASQIKEIRERVMLALETLTPSPLIEVPIAMAPIASNQEMEISNDDSDE